MKRRRLRFGQNSDAAVAQVAQQSGAPPPSSAQPSPDQATPQSSDPSSSQPSPGPVPAGISVKERPMPGVDPRTPDADQQPPPSSGWHPDAGNAQEWRADSGYPPPGPAEGGPHRPSRDLYPEQLQVINQPGADLPRNPDYQPGFDRTRPWPADEKARRLGMQSQENRIFDLPRGDAGAGETSFRRIQMYSRLDFPATTTVTGNPMFRALPLATSRSSDPRPRFWHVSFFGFGRIDEALVPTAPFPESEITINTGFIGPVQSAPGLILSPLTPYVPQIATFQGRAMIHDESGKRFIDVDVIGTRSFDVYAFSVTVFLLVPSGGYEVDGTLLNNVNHNPELTGLVQNAMYGARVVPTVLNDTNNVDQRTVGITLSGLPGTVKVPIPPGARKVTIINNGRGATQQLYEIDFDTGGPAATGATTDQGVIVLNPVTFRTDAIAIPNATAIRFRALLNAAVTSFSIVFEVDGQ